MLNQPTRMVPYISQLFSREWFGENVSDHADLELMGSFFLFKQIYTKIYLVKMVMLIVLAR